MSNMVTNVCAKSNYDRLCINKALGLRKSGKNNKNKNRKSKNNVRSDWGPLSDPKIRKTTATTASVDTVSKLL